RKLGAEPTAADRPPRRAEGAGGRNAGRGHAPRAEALETAPPVARSRADVRGHRRVRARDGARPGGREGHRRESRGRLGLRRAGPRVPPPLNHRRRSARFTPRALTGRAKDPAMADSTLLFAISDYTYLRDALLREGRAPGSVERVD